MQIVTDSGTDVQLATDQLEALNIHVVPLVVTLNEETYQEGLDIDKGSFYRALAATDSLPTTSQPSAGVFAELYRELARVDPEILSVHISSGLSGTVSSAQGGAAMVPEADVTVVDTKTLSAGAGWQVEAAARAAQAGWSKERILELLGSISDATDSLFTLNDLKYLIHGGRISHMKGLLASLLNIKPIIGVEKGNGIYEQQGQARTFKGAIKGLGALMTRQYAPGSSLRVQVLHANDPEAAEMLRAEIDSRFDCTWSPVAAMSLVLGAHTGPSMVGAAFAPLETFGDIPG